MSSSSALLQGARSSSASRSHPTASPGSTTRAHAPLVSEAVGLLSIPVERFGHWLRLRTEQASGTDAPMLRIYLELKE